jgi:hypothetical protein
MPTTSFDGLLIVAAAALAAPLALGLFPRIRLPAIVLEIVLEPRERIRSSSPRRSGTAITTADPTRHSCGSATAILIQDRPARPQRHWIGT